MVDIGELKWLAQLAAADHWRGAGCARGKEVSEKEREAAYQRARLEIYRNGSQEERDRLHNFSGSDCVYSFLAGVIASLPVLAVAAFFVLAGMKCS